MKMESESECVPGLASYQGRQTARVGWHCWRPDFRACPALPCGAALRGAAPHPSMHRTQLHASNVPCPAGQRWPPGCQGWPCRWRHRRPSRCRSAGASRGGEGRQQWAAGRQRRHRINAPGLASCSVESPPHTLQHKPRHEHHRCLTSMMFSTSLPTYLPSTYTCSGGVAEGGQGQGSLGRGAALGAA